MPCCRDYWSVGLIIGTVQIICRILKNYLSMKTFKTGLFTLGLSFLSLAQGQDLGVVSSSSPISGCVLSSTEVVEVFVFNFGTDVTTPFDISYTIDGGAPVTETVNLGTFLSSASYTHTFSIPADLSSPGSYSICAYTTISGDGNSANDTSCIAVVSDALTIGGNTQTNTTVCYGNNSGAITLTGALGSVVDWQSSETSGASWINLGNTGSSQNYSNIIVETWYRSLNKNGLCPQDTSSVTVISIDQPSVGGTLSGPDTICESPNSGVINLSGELGLVDSWEFSINGGFNWTPITNTTTSHSFSNLSSTTLFRALVNNGTCAIAYSDTLTVNVIPGAVGGSLFSTASNVCFGQNSETLQLSGYAGVINHWESSSNGGGLWTNISNTTDSYVVSNLTIETWYRVILQGCTNDTSSVLVISIDPLSVSGILDGDTIVCYGVNNGTLDLSGETGSVTDWIFSNDGGSSWVSLGQTNLSYSYSNLTDSSLFQTIVQSGTCPADTSNSVAVNIFPYNYGASPDTTINEGDVANLNAFGGSVYSWNPVADLSDALSQSPIATPLETTIFIVEITDTNSCVYYDSVVVSVIAEVPDDLVIANIITANGDGYNDNWEIQGAELLSNVKVTVISKKGVIVFSSEDYRNEWEGTFQGNYLPSGTYYYIVEHSDFNTKKGHLNILTK